MLNILARQCEDVRDIKSAVSQLDFATNECGFKRLGIADTAGRGYTTDGKFIDVSARKFFNDAISGKQTVSDALVDVFGGEPIIVYAVPISSGKATTGVLFATHSVHKYRDILALDSFSSAGHSYIVNSIGDVVVGPPDCNDNILSADSELNINSGNVTDKILRGESLVLTAPDKYISFSPTGINDWQLVSVIPKQVAAQHSSSFEKTSLVIAVTLGIIFTILLLLFFYSQHKNHERLRALAYSDSVSGLGNSNCFMKDGGALISAAPEKRFVLISFDIKKFKLVNDMNGFAAGNRVLHEIGKIMLARFEAPSVTARTSNDNFVALMPIDSSFDGHALCQSISNDISKITTAGGARLNLPLAMGVYIIEPGEHDLAACLDKALIAKARVKENHEQLCALYSDDLRKELILESEIEKDMAAALAGEQFEVFYQPQVEIKSGRVIGCEALIRWRHPYKQMLTPQMFIPVFERNGFIYRVDLFVARSVCKRLVSWCESGFSIFPVAINLSRVDLCHDEIVDDLLGILKEFNLSPNALELEITESVLLTQRDSIAKNMARLHDAGFRIAMDDFGAGYSSLNMLKELPIDVLKLDRVFFANIVDTDKGNIIIDCVVRMAKSLGMQVVAEGVETAEQLAFLNKIGCDFAQGYYFSKPVPVHEYETMIDTCVQSSPSV
ncbi:MAG: EAL domain-containing protein, partial [Clostridia bacterium]